MAFHERHRIEPGIGMVAGVKANFQDVLIHFVQQSFQFRLKIHKARCMRVNTNGQPVFFGPHFRDCRNAVAVSRPLRRVHLLGLISATRRRRAPLGNGIDQHQMLRTMRDKRFAGTHRPVHNVIPGRRVVERAKHNAADQLQIVFGQPIGENCRVFGHKAHRAKLNPFVASFCTFTQNRFPSRVSRIIRKFNAPGTGRITDTNCHWGVSFSQVRKTPRLSMICRVMTPSQPQ